MSEVVAEVAEEKVPKIRWPERVLIIHDLGDFKAHTHAPDVDMMAKWARDGGIPFQILRVRPPSQPKKQWVSIEWSKVKVSLATLGDRELSFAWPEIVSAIERHARIVDEE